MPFSGCPYSITIKAMGIAIVFGWYAYGLCDSPHNCFFVGMLIHEFELTPHSNASDNESDLRVCMQL
jgi:hypothetical protein